MKYLYLTIDLCCILVPFIFSFHPRIQFYKTWRAFVPSCLITGTLFLIWDEIYTSWGVWGFNSRYLLGVYIGNLPLEELLFFLCIPYACVFTYFCLKDVFKLSLPEGLTNLISGIALLITLSVALTNTDKLYTVAIMGFAALLLLIHLLFIKGQYLGAFYLSYLAILPPFFLSNGLLTGMIIPEEVVWYNNQENLGIRMITIPIEDSAYALVLLLLNITLYEYFRRTTKKVPG